jgi:hypothetical protein
MTKIINNQKYYEFKLPKGETAYYRTFSNDCLMKDFCEVFLPKGMLNTNYGTMLYSYLLVNLPVKLINYSAIDKTEKDDGLYSRFEMKYGTTTTNDLETSSCKHEWVKYQGLVENFEYCKLCDQKRS